MLPDESFRLFLAELAFPIVGVAADARYVATVCLNARLRALDVRSALLRECQTRPEKIAWGVRSLEQTLQFHQPATLVLERDFRPRIDPVAPRIAEHARRIAVDRGIRVARISIAEASHRVVTDEDTSFTSALRVLIARYPALATEIAPDGRERFRDPEHWRRHRALATAFCLAHAVAIEAIVRAGKSS